MRLRHITSGTALAGLVLLTGALPALAATSGVTVSGAVWLDLDGDGVRDAEDPGRAGVPVTLRTAATILDATVSAADGSWTFGNVAPGSYTVVVNPPIDHRVTTGAGTVAIDVATSDVTDGPSIGLGSPVASGTDVAVTVVADGSAAGSAFTWLVDAYNLGNGAADGPVSVRLVLDGAHVATGATGTGWACEVGGAIVTCSTPDGLPGAGHLPTITMLSTPTGDVGAATGVTGTVRLDGAFDAAPLNDESSASRTIGADVAAIDTDGDGAADLTQTGAPTSALLMVALLALAAGTTTLRTVRRT